MLEGCLCSLAAELLAPLLLAMGGYEAICAAETPCGRWKLTQSTSQDNNDQHFLCIAQPIIMQRNIRGEQAYTIWRKHPSGWIYPSARLLEHCECDCYELAKLFQCESHLVRHSIATIRNSAI